MSDTSIPNQPGDAGSDRSVVPGCFIFGAIVTVFGGLAVLYAVVFVLQSRAIKEFTSDQPADIQVFEPTEEQIKSMQDKFAAIKASATQQKMDRILLSRDDLNTMIATYEILKDFRGTTFVERITSQGIETRMTQPLKQKRHLNAIFVFQPELRRRTIALRVKNIKPDQGTIPEQYIKVYDSLSLFKIDPENPNIKPIIPNLSRVYTESGSVVFETGRPADDQTPLPE